MSATEGLCKCGCGKKAPIARTTQRGLVKGQPCRYLPGHAGHRLTDADRQAAIVARQYMPDPPTAAEAYAEQLAHLSTLVVGAVHDEDPAVALARIRVALALPAPDGIDPVVALVTVLAAQVDPDTTTSDRLGWTEGLTPARPRSPGSQRTERGAA